MTIAIAETKPRSRALPRTTSMKPNLESPTREQANLKSSYCGDIDCDSVRVLRNIVGITMKSCGDALTYQ